MNIYMPELKQTMSSAITWLVLAMAIAYCAAQSNPAVRDTDGQALLPGVKYYILQAFTRATGGGLTLINRNGSCPLYVGQEEDAGARGLPVVFTPLFTKDALIAENKDLRIAFSASTTCVRSTAWQTGAAVRGQRLIVTGTKKRGYEGFFKIRKDVGYGYRVEWCPTDACPTCRFRCGTAGIFVENGKWLLALDGSAHLVVFSKA